MSKHVYSAIAQPTMNTDVILLQHIGVEGITHYAGTIDLSRLRNGDRLSIVFQTHIGGKWLTFQRVDLENQQIAEPALIFTFDLTTGLRITIRQTAGVDKREIMYYIIAQDERRRLI